MRKSVDLWWEHMEVTAGKGKVVSRTPVSKTLNVTVSIPASSCRSGSESLRPWRAPLRFIADLRLTVVIGERMSEDLSANKRRTSRLVEAFRSAGNAWLNGLEN